MKEIRYAHANSDTGLATDYDTSNANLDTKLRDSDTKLGHSCVDLDSVPRSNKEILERAGVTYHRKNINYIISIVEAGYLGMTNSEHSNASNQNYRRSKK